MKNKMYDGYYKYDQSVAQEYDKDREGEEHWLKENCFIEEYFKNGVHLRVLDAPVGTGRFLSMYPKSSEIYGVDISDEMLAVASKKLESKTLLNVQLRKGSIFSLDFQDNYFDCSICWRLAHLLPVDLLEEGLRELNRVTAGETLVQAYVKGPFRARLINKIKRLPAALVSRVLRNHSIDKPWSHIKAYFHSEGTFLEAFSASGFVINRRVKLCDYHGHEIYVFILRRG